MEIKKLNVFETFTSIDIPMADDPSFMTTSNIFLKNNEKNIIDNKLINQNNCFQRRSPPFASEDELSESELSELELRVARGDFASTPNDFNYKKTAWSSCSLSTISCDSKNEQLDDELNCKQNLNKIELNSTPFNELIKEQFNCENLTKKNNYKMIELDNGNQVMWLQNEFTSMPCLAFEQKQNQQQQPQQINSSTLFANSNNFNNCFINKNNEINNDLNQCVVSNTNSKTKKIMTRSFTAVFFSFFFIITYKKIIFVF